MLGFLILEDGFSIEGHFSGRTEVFGEVVFNTSPSGYEEVVTDLSYFNQIVVFTSPMVGNYGIYREQWESPAYQAKGIVCLEMQNSNRDSKFLSELKKQNLGVLTDVDTRALTLHLRDRGTIWGAIVEEENRDQAIIKAENFFKQKEMLPKDWVYEVSRKNIEVLPGQMPRGPRIGVLDFGVKNNILKIAQEGSSSVVVFPSRTKPSIIEAHNIDGLILSNGPGDPELVNESPDIISHFVGKKPIFAICMGHQLLARALGARTYKLKFGHRGSNHPIRDEVVNLIYVASHNHGYAVDEKTLPSRAKVTMTNLNDGTVAGFHIKEERVLSVQYHPESCPGPKEARALFHYFFKEMLVK